MSGNVYRIVTTRRAKHNDEPIWILFECDAVSVADLSDRLSDGQIISGHELKTRHSHADDQIEIYDRVPLGLGRGMVQMIELPRRKLVEYEDEYVDAAGKPLPPPTRSRRTAT